MAEADLRREGLPELLRAWSEADIEAGRIARAQDMVEAAEEIERLRELTRGKVTPPIPDVAPGTRTAILPDVLPWQRADLFAWGETVRTGTEIWRRTWAFEDAWLSDENVDGLVYRISNPDGAMIYEGVSEEDGDRAVRDAIISRYPEVFGKVDNAPAP